MKYKIDIEVDSDTGVISVYARNPNGKAAKAKKEYCGWEIEEKCAMMPMWFTGTVFKTSEEKCEAVDRIGYFISDAIRKAEFEERIKSGEFSRINE